MNACTKQTFRHIFNVLLFNNIMAPLILPAEIEPLEIKEWEAEVRLLEMKPLSDTYFELIIREKYLLTELRVRRVHF